MLRRVGAAALGFVVSGVAVAVLVWRVDVASAFRTLSAVEVWLPLVLATGYLSIFLLRGYRWHVMLDDPRVRFGAALDGVVLGHAGNNVLPARGGELVRMEALSRSVAGVSRVTALSSIAAERILDGLVLLMVLVVCVALAGEAATGREWVPRLLLAVSLIFVGACLVLVALRYFEKPIAARLERSERAFAAVLASLAEKIYRAIGFLGWNLITMRVLLCCLGIWALEGAVFVIAIAGLGLKGPAILMGYTCLAVVSFGSLVPSSPGYVGVFEAMMVLALALFRVPEDHALAAGVLVHVCQFVPVTLWGLILVLRGSVSRLVRKA